ncbi:MAG: alpha/beta hydrolase [Hamadaea sp.]|nr:alpha/beta hydrolase [Hamadaea sp.]
MVPITRRHLGYLGLASASALFLPTAAASAAPASTATSSPTLYLPRPTGPHAVGATTVHLTDTSRPDPWAPDVPVRRLMVTIWYPAHTRHGDRAAYMTAEESRLYLIGKRSDLPPDILSTVRTNAFAGARPAGRPRSLPLVVLSPGYTQPRATLTGLAEDLASHGYAVAAVDHAHETYAVTFPDGSIAECASCAIDHEPGFFERLYQVRAADVSFVLDRLTGAYPLWEGGGLIDPRRIGMSGHSAGGASAIAAMAGDARIRAGIDMDGTTRELVPEGGLGRPFMFLGTQAHHSPGGPDQSWDRDWSRLTGWKRWLVVAGTEHASFHDIAVFGDQLGVDFGATTTGTRSAEITRRYTRAYFDLHLRSRPQPLLEWPSARYPEVTIAAR